MKRRRRWMHGYERAVAAVAVVAAAAVVLVVGSMSDERRSKQAATGSSVTGKGHRRSASPWRRLPVPR